MTSIISEGDEERSMFSEVKDQAQAIGSQEIIKRISAKAFGRLSSENADDSHSVLPADDALSDLKSNIAELEDVSHRLRFMMREVSYLIRKN